MFELTAFILAYLMYLIVEAPFASILSGVVKKKIREQVSVRGNVNEESPDSVGIEMSQDIKRKISKEEKEHNKRMRNFDPIEGV